MNKNKVFAEKIMFVVLVIIFIVSLLHVRKRFYKDVSGFSDLVDKSKAIDIRRIKERLFVSTKRPRDYYEKPYRSPLEKPLELLMSEDLGVLLNAGYGQEEKPREELVLEGIIWGDRGTIAIISGNVLKEGEMVSDAKVLSISKNEVILIRDGNEIRLAR